MLCRCLCDRKQFFGIEIEVSCFPVVDENRALLVLILTADQMIAVQLMIVVCHAVQTVLGIDHDNFRCLEFCVLLQFPAEVLRMDSHHCTHHIELV